jgi:aspartate--ammonia ligase
MQKVMVPKDYQSKLDIWETERAIKLIKDTFQLALAGELRLRRITAPIILKAQTGLNDDLNGKEAPVSFPVKILDGDKAEIVQSLAKWKRYALAKHGIEEDMGIYTDMNALRPDEDITNIHSVYVDQWDWEKVINKDKRTMETLYSVVDKIYKAIKRTEFILCEHFPKLIPFLPEKIHFFHAEDLRERYPDLTPKEREYMSAKEYGAVFIRGIGADLSNGEPHDGRAPDYDDWSTKAEDGKVGLNGDIIVWNPILEMAFEISSMGIRVDEDSLLRQLKIRGCEERKTLMFHSMLLSKKLPYTMGGGIGQSRLCMLLLRKAHIGEVQAGLWPKEVHKECEDAGIFLI